jgi:hypothetical protein
VSGSAKQGATDQAAELIARVERLAELADERWTAVVDADRAAGHDPEEPDSPTAPKGPRQRARELRDHVRGYLIPRARDLDAPLLVAIVGPTGAGKSSVLNTIAGSAISPTGVLRPTTRELVVVGTDADIGRLAEDGPLSSIDEGRLELHTLATLPDVVIVDTPDVDSVEHENRALADRIVEAADLCIFVTTATRYADRVPWDVLGRARQRGLPVTIVINRLPPGEGGADDARVIREDMARLISDSGLRVLDVLTVREGAVDEAGTALSRDSLGPLLAQLATLSADEDARRELASSALAGALVGISPLVEAVAVDLEREAAAIESLLDKARSAYAEQVRQMLHRLSTSPIVRAEIIRHWHSYVGADRITRLFSGGIGQVRGTLAALLGRTPAAPVDVVQQGVAEDIAAMVLSHAAEGARKAADGWKDDQEGAPLLDAHPELWSSSDGLETATRSALDAWVASIADDVKERGASRRVAARVAAIGVNAMAVSVMLLVFTYTGGLTGVEVGIAGGTAVLSQKLLNAVFGEAAVQELLSRARQRIKATLTTLLDDERQRFDELLGDSAKLRELADKLRALFP